MYIPSQIGPAEGQALPAQEDSLHAVLGGTWNTWSRLPTVPSKTLIEVGLNEPKLAETVPLC